MYSIHLLRLFCMVIVTGACHASVILYQRKKMGLAPALYATVLQFLLFRYVLFVRMFFRCFAFHNVFII